MTIPVPLKVQDEGPVMICASDHIHPTLANVASHHPSSSLSHVGTEHGLPVLSLGIQQTGNGFIRRFKEIVKCLPENIPIVPERSRKISTVMRSLLPYIDWCLIT